MLGTTKKKRILSTLTGIALICAGSISTAFANGSLSADINFSGKVTVNGERAISNATVISGSTITTGTGSTATIGLGRNGRMELSPDSSVTLKYSDNSIVAMLASGRVLLTNAAGIGTTVTTRSATVVADSGGTNTFSVDIGCGDEAKCAQTMVQTTTGLVTLKTADMTKQVSAGTDAVAGGSATGCKPCFRPQDDGPDTDTTGISDGALAALLIGLGGAAITAIIFGRQNDGRQSGNVIAVSPVQ